MRTQLNLQLYRGDDEHRRIFLQQKTETGIQPFDLSHIERADLQAVERGKVVLSLSSEEGTIVFLERLAGQLLLHFPHTLTAKAIWRSANYDLQLIDKQGQVRTVLTGVLTLTHDITRIDRE